MMYVPTNLGSLHQCGAVVLWTVALALTNLTRATKAPAGINRAVLRELERHVAKLTKSTK